MISTIIPALNESKTISDVVTTCKQSELVSEVIVIDDGSVDNTYDTAVNAGAKTIRIDENRGKGYAMLLGAKEAKEDVFLFLDADLIGLNIEHVNNMIEPVIKGDCDSTLGLFTKGRMKTDLAHMITPFLSGQRCIKKDILIDALSTNPDLGYGVEIAISLFLLKNKKKVIKIPLNNLTHVMKEEKNGQRKGIKRRLKMYEEILAVLFKK